MNIKIDIEKARKHFMSYKNWNDVVKEQELNAMWGCHYGNQEIKVQTTKQHDKMENTIIELQDLEEERHELFEIFWSEKRRLDEIIYKYAKCDDYIILSKYVMGCDLEEIPLKGKQNNPKNVVNGAIKRLQKNIDFEEEVAMQPKHIQEIIKGKDRKCSKCENGFISYQKEEVDRFIFQCSGCKRRLRANKIGGQQKNNNT